MSAEATADRRQILKDVLGVVEARPYIILSTYPHFAVACIPYVTGRKSFSAYKNTRHAHNFFKYFYQDFRIKICIKICIFHTN